MLEGAFVLLVFLGTLISIFDMGQLLFIHQSMTERVRAAVRWGIVRPYDQASIKNMVRFYQPTNPGGGSFMNLTDAQVSVELYTPVIGGSDPEEAANQRIIVKIQNYPFQFFSPWIAQTYTNNHAVVESLPYEWRP